MSDASAGAPGSSKAAIGACDRGGFGSTPADARSTMKASERGPPSKPARGLPARPDGLLPPFGHVSRTSRRLAGRPPRTTTEIIPEP